MHALARRTADYIGKLVIGQGRHAGSPFALLPWERRFLAGALAPGVGEAALSLARGGGKSTFTAAIAAAALDGPLAEPAAEVVIVASSHEQAGICFRHVFRFLEPQIARNRFRVLNTVNMTKIEHRETGTILQVKGSDPRRLHGAAPSLVIGDELAQWPPARVDEMLAALRTAAGKIADSRVLLIGTRPADEMHPFSVALREADYCQTHAAGEADPPFQRRTWCKANPSLPHMPDLERAIAREAKAAKRDPSMLASFRALRLNMGTADTDAAVLLDAGVWQAAEGDAGRPLHGRGATWGIDLGTSASVSAIACFWPSTGALESMAAFPRQPSLAERGLRDGVSSLYVECARRGELIQCGGEAVDIAELLRAALDRFGRPARIVADRWREKELYDSLNAAGVPRAVIEVRGMGYKDGAADVRGFRRAVLEGRVTPLPSLLLRSALSEARTVSDPAGNEKLSKGSGGGRRMRARDDAAAAAILAVAAGARQPATPPRRVRYHGAV